MTRAAIFLALFLSIAAAAAGAEPFTGPELSDGYMTVVDENGRVILETGLAVQPGDGFIDAENRLYEVRAVEGTLARARFVRREPPPSSAALARPVQAPVPSDSPPAPPAGAPTEPAGVEPPSPAPPPQLVAVYYTHNDESYIPTDGKPTIPGNGGIFSVGGAFAQRLVALGYAVENDQTRHDPHDANAYQRSRRTFKRLLEQKPSALFDIHRDSAPRSAYQYEVDGQPAVKILLVVGRQNQNRETTMNYAKQIKAAADGEHKGLIRGIFIAHGNYNQDLNPQAMLVEFGTQYNTREEAERSAALFADLVPLFLAPAAPGLAAGTGAPPPPPPGGYWHDILTITGVLAAGIVGFLFLSTGSWREAKRKLARFRRFEFVNFLGKKRKD
jgi:stage II sporulation protein P